VLAQDVVAGLTVPPADNSAMDGYAVRSADCAAPGAELPVSQRIPAGSVAGRWRRAAPRASSPARPCRAPTRW
jgi:molybdopterin biosynthesis enzyme